MERQREEKVRAEGQVIFDQRLTSRFSHRAHGE
jgi:hypothetical protein